MCIECDACVDICPTDCINFVDNDTEEKVRDKLRVPALNLDQSLYVSGKLKTGRRMVKDEDVMMFIVVFVLKDVLQGHGILRKLLQRESYFDK